MPFVKNEYTVLLVDDENDILDFLSYTLEKEGYKVFTADNGKEGIKLAKNIRNLDYKGAAKTVVNTYREAKKAKKVINYRRKKKK